MRTRAPVVAILVLALCLLGCSSDVDPELMAGQVARVNRDLALLTERVDALEKQLGGPPPNGAPPAPASAATGVPAPSATLPDALEIHVGDEDGVRIHGETLAGEALAARLADHAGKGPGARVAIHIAASTPPARLAEVIELARKSGIREISVVTELP